MSATRPPKHPSESPVRPAKTAASELFDRLCAEASRLPLKHRVRLIDALAAQDVAEREDGLKFSLRSLTEFKRFSKSKPAGMNRWLTGFAYPRAQDVLLRRG